MYQLFLRLHFDKLFITYFKRYIYCFKTSYRMDYTEWDYITIYKHLTPEFITEFKDYLDWYWVSSEQVLYEDFIEQHQDLVDWHMISKTQMLSLDFIIKYIDRLDFHKLAVHQKTVSEAFISQHIDKIRPFELYSKRKLSEAFIRQHLNVFL